MVWEPNWCEPSPRKVRESLFTITRDEMRRQHCWTNCLRAPMR